MKKDRNIITYACHQTFLCKKDRNIITYAYHQSFLCKTRNYQPHQALLQAIDLLPLGGFGQAVEAPKPTNLGCGHSVCFSQISTIVCNRRTISDNDDLCKSKNIYFFSVWWISSTANHFLGATVNQQGHM